MSTSVRVKSGWSKMEKFRRSPGPRVRCCCQAARGRAALAEREKLVWAGGRSEEGEGSDGSGGADGAGGAPGRVEGCGGGGPRRGGNRAGETEQMERMERRGGLRVEGSG